MLFVGTAVGFTLSPTLATLGQLVDQDGSGSGDYGSAYALFNMFHAVGMMAGPFLGGVLTDMISVPSTVVTVSITIMVLVIVLLGILRAMKPNLMKQSIQEKAS